MKKIVIISILLLVTVSSFYAQNMNRQRIKLLKTAFITDAISLTPNEAEKFWPVYNLYSEKLQELNFKIESGMFHDIQLTGGIENLSEIKAQKIIDQSLIYEKEISDIKIKMTKELSKIISAVQIVKLQKSERDFKRRILQEYGRRRKGQ